MIVPATVTVTVNRSFEPQLRQMIDVRLGRAVRTLREIVKSEVSSPYPPPSAPGTPPHRRTGGLKRAVFAEKVGQMDWVYGYRVVDADPDRPGSNRERLGLWMELGTGSHRRHPSGMGGMVSRPSPIVRTSMYPRPVLLPTLMQDGPRVIHFYLSN